MVTQDRTRITVETLVPLAMLSSIMTIVQMDIKILKELVTLLIADLINKVIWLNSVIHQVGVHGINILKFQVKIQLKLQMKHISV